MCVVVLYVVFGMVVGVMCVLCVLCVGVFTLWLLCGYCVCGVCGCLLLMYHVCVLLCCVVS